MTGWLVMGRGPELRRGFWGRGGARGRPEGLLAGGGPLRLGAAAGRTTKGSSPSV